MPKEANKKQNKEKKHFFKDFKAELKRVIWPTLKQLVNNTSAVITIVLITAVIVFALDFVFRQLNEYGIEGLKSVVDTTNSTANELTNLNDAVSDNGETNEVAENSTTNTQTNNEVSSNTVGE